MRGEGLHHGNCYSVTQQVTFSTTNPSDLVSILASSLSRVVLQGVQVSAPSTAGAPVNMGIEIFRGSTSAAIGTGVTPVNHVGWSAAAAAGSSATGASTTLLSTASAVRLVADAMSNGRYSYCPPHGYEPIFEVSQRLHVRGSNIAVAGSVNVTATFVEIGKRP
jgi:uncharacterized Zn-binding protein involved in type VI secretion